MKHYSLAREQMVKTLIAYEGYATANGAAGGTSIIDANLIGVNDFVTEKAILILEGPAAGEDRAATVFSNITGTITISPAVTDPAGAPVQITEGTHYRILNISSVELDMLNVLARLGTAADPAGTGSIFAWLAKLWGGIAGSVVASGTLTTSSATVPADTGRAEASNYWNGCWLMPLTGAVAMEPKKITSFNNAGGVFTLDSEHPLTAAPGLVTYVILRATDDLVPAAGSIAGSTPAHVIGNKSDPPNFNTSNATIIASLMGWVRGIARSKTVLVGNAEAGSDASNIISAASLNQAAGFWKGQHILMTTGVNTGLSRPVVAFDAATDKITVSPAFPAVVGVADEFIILSDYSDPPDTTGRMQEKATTIDLNQAAATYDILTGTAQVTILESLVIQMPVGAAGGALTSISIQTNDATPAVIIDNITGAVANLTSEAQLAWTGVIRIGVGKLIRLTIAGGAHGVAYVCNVNAQYRAVVSGGTLV